ncbi:Hypothetical_protein [Hexamita inflata]|uniref:Hypothetical_protein n=1 Tax=Hexamita inflata TaxID=28002 RepID=A0AA86QL39_9EUKA|nr:Hypothetical protein HINF_LOCUS48275 [Hexamita inflata]
MNYMNYTLLFLIDELLYLLFGLNSINLIQVFGYNYIRSQINVVVKCQWIDSQFVDQKVYVVTHLKGIRLTLQYHNFMFAIQMTNLYVSPGFSRNMHFITCNTQLQNFCGVFVILIIKNMSTYIIYDKQYFIQLQNQEVQILQFSNSLKRGL